MIDHYADYAQFYDQGSTTDIAGKVDLIKHTISRLNPNTKSLLEIACGTGNLLVELQSYYEITGLDLSSAMLAVAKERLVGVELQIGDMTSFQLGRKFDAIICVFDSVNHLLVFKDWESLFDRVKEHLNVGGVFVMDVNTISKLDRFSTFPTSRLDLDKGYQIAKVTKEGMVYSWKIDIHLPQSDGAEKVIRNNIPEAAFPLKQIKDALKQRFTKIEQFTQDGVAADESVDRVYFAARL